MRRLAALFVLIAGCSTAPIADLLDRLAPGRIEPEKAAPYGGVCQPQQTVPPVPATAVLPGPPPTGGPALPGPPVVAPGPPVIPPGPQPLPLPPPDFGSPPL